MDTTSSGTTTDSFHGKGYRIILATSSLPLLLRGFEEKFITSSVSPEQTLQHYAKETSLTWVYRQVLITRYYAEPAPNPAGWLTVCFVLIDQEYKWP